jgi:hypothetical protein
MEMLCGVLTGRAVTASDVAAGETQPQVNPAASRLQALLATIRCPGFNGLDLTDVRAALGGHS